MLPLPAGPSVSRGLESGDSFNAPFPTPPDAPFPVSICDTNLDDSDSEHARTKAVIKPRSESPSLDPLSDTVVNPSSAEIIAGRSLAVCCGATVVVCVTSAAGFLVYVVYRLFL